MAVDIQTDGQLIPPRVFRVNALDLCTFCKSLYKLYSICYVVEDFISVLHTSKLGKYSFNNYVGMIFFPFLTTYPLATWSFFTLNMHKKGQFRTTYPPNRPRSYWTTPKPTNRKFKEERNCVGNCVSEKLRTNYS